MVIRCHPSQISSQQHPSPPQTRSNFVEHPLQTTENDCHQWLSDSFRVHQMHFFDWGSGAYGATQIRSWFKGALLLRGREDRKDEGRERGGEAGGKGEREGTPPNANYGSAQWRIQGGGWGDTSPTGGPAYMDFCG